MKINFPRKRRGTITLMLSLMIMIAATAAVAILAKTELATRRSELDRTAAQRLHEVLDLVDREVPDVSSVLRFPIDTRREWYIEVERTGSDESPLLRAREIRGERVLRTIERIRMART